MKTVHRAVLVGRDAGRGSQRGVVLIIALIALVSMTLAAMALVRTVDTGTLVAGNLSFRQDVSQTGNIGIEEALNWLDATYTANAALNPATDPSHPLNKSASSAGNMGYYSYYIDSGVAVDPLTMTWSSSNSASAGSFNGNEVSYIIQRMCGIKDTISDKAECLSSDADSDTHSHKGCHYGQDCGQVVAGGKSPIYRITVRTAGPKNTLSYLQALVY